MLHAFMWLMTLLGVILLFRAHSVRNLRWNARAFTGSLFLGWGLFNLIEGLVDHHLLHLHHVVEQQGPSVFDFLFLLSGVVFIAGGWLAIRSARARA